MTTIIKQEKNELVTESVEYFSGFVSQMGLPIENVLSDVSEREVVISQLSSIVNKISPDSKTNAVYLSRFAAAAYIGLFDAALNYVWDEVILRLRERVVLYGLEYFFDNAINNPNERSSYKDKVDLLRIRDYRLLEVCRNLEIIDDTLFKRLAHILDMRNYVSAAHPNTDNISGYELLSYVDICVTKVIELEFPQSVLDVKNLITRIKDPNHIFDPFSLQKIRENCNSFGLRTTDSLFNTIFGIYVSSESTKEIKNKCLIICELIWEKVSEENKYNIGMKYDRYASSLEENKRDLTELFLREFDGLKYLSTTTKEFKITKRINQLRSAHFAWDNYYYETPIIKEIMEIINNASDIPEQLEDSLLNTIIMCRVGNGNYGGYNGVSPGGKPYYDKFFSILNSRQISKLLCVLDSEDYPLNLWGFRRANNLKEILTDLKSDSLSELLREFIDYLLTLDEFSKLNGDVNYNRYKKSLTNI